jgi:DNA (cytosine-5)-methyltransferase 1
MNWYSKRRRAQNDQDFETWIRGGVCPTLNAFDNTGDSRATVIIMFDNSYRDGLRLQKGNTVNTLSAKMGTGGNNVPFVAIPIQGTIIGRQDHNGPQGKGFGDETDPMYTLDSVSQHGVVTDMQVRRLTPIECERLMGWPDNHTLPRADGKENADTTRYKMCGNGVASPVAQWIGQHLMEIMSGP